MLVSSSPTGLPFGEKSLRSTPSTPRLESHFLELAAEQDDAAVQVSILSSAWTGMPLFLMAASSAGALGRRKACDERRQAVGEAEAGHRLHQFLRVLVVDDRLDHQLVRARHRLIEFGRPPLIIIGKQMDRSEQIDGGVGIGDLPQRRVGDAAARAPLPGRAEQQWDAKRGDHSPQDRFQHIYSNPPDPGFARRASRSKLNPHLPLSIRIRPKPPSMISGAVR